MSPFVSNAAVTCSLLALVLMAGCGGSDSDSGSALTKAEMIKQGDAICKKTNDVQGAAITKADKQEPIAERSEPDRLKLVVSAVLTPASKEAEELAELTPPAGDEEQLEAIVSGLETAVDESTEEPSPVLEGSAVTPFTQVNKLAAKYGFKVCSEAP
jgi:hypothetical protein